MRLKFKLITFSVADFPLVVGSDVNKDLGPKAKDTGHKVKAKALGYWGIKAKAKDFGPKAKDLGLKAKAKDLRCQSQ